MTFRSWITKILHQQQQQQQSQSVLVVVRGVLATLPFLVYFRDDYFSITRVRGTSMEPTIQNGDIVLIRKRDAGTVLFNILQAIGFVAVPCGSCLKNMNDDGRTVDEINKTGDSKATKASKTSHVQYDSTRSSSSYDDDRSHAMLYRLEEKETCWFISSAHHSPIVLPGHVVLYRNPYQANECLVKRTIGIGGQRIATKVTKQRWISRQQQLKKDSISVAADENELPNTNNTAIDVDLHDSISSDHPFILQYLRLRQQQDKNNYYNLRLPPHFIYTEGDNVRTSQQDCRAMGNQPVSQNLVLGVVEYVLWPPSRMQRIRRQPVYAMYNTVTLPRAIWDK
jgi:Signal peptidase, peptidase S26